VASTSRKAPRCLPGAGNESDVPVEILARSEAGDDGRLRSRRPGAGTAEKGMLPRPLASEASAPRLTEAARAGSGGRHKVADPSLWPCDRRRRETGGRFGPHGRRRLRRESPTHPDSSSPGAPQNDTGGLAPEVATAPVILMSRHLVSS